MVSPLVQVEMEIHLFKMVDIQYSVYQHLSDLKVVVLVEMEIALMLAIMVDLEEAVVEEIIPQTISEELEM